MPLIVATLIIVAVMGVVQFLTSLISALVDPGPSSTYVSDGTSFAFSYSLSSPIGILVGIIGWIIALVVSATLQSGYYSAILEIANGQQQVTIGSFFRPRNIGNVIIAGLITSVITIIGVALCIIPGVIASIFFLFTIVALLDRNLAPLDAIKASVDLAKNNLGQVALTWLVLVGCLIAGFAVCGVGLLVAFPVMALIQAYAWRKLTGGQVAELNPHPLPPGPPPPTGPREY